MMPGTEPCGLHEFTGCSICSGLDKKLAAEEAAADTLWMRFADADPRPRPIGSVVAAQYPGQCAGCGNDFRPGQPIRWSLKENGWVVSGCCE